MKSLRKTAIICLIGFLFIFTGCDENVNIQANWTLVSIEADDFAVSIDDGSMQETMTLFISPGNTPETYTVSGFSGVNSFHGTVTEKNANISFSALATTMMIGPEASQKLEDVYLKTLQAGGKVSAEQVNDQTFLTVTNTSNKSTLIFKQTFLENTVWNLNMYNIHNAVTGIPEMAELPTVGFSLDGTLFGSTGVNRISATYTATPEGILSVSPLAVTRMAAETAEMRNFEMRLLELFADISAYEMSGNTLTLRNDAGEALLVYQK